MTDTPNKSYLSNELMMKLKNRDTETLSQLFKEINPYLQRILISRKIFNEHAFDLLQDTWSTFLNHLDQFEGRSQLKTFLAGILINKIREFQRHQKRVQPEEDFEKILSQNFTPDGWWKQDPKSPEFLMQSQETLKFIQECLDDLTDNQRDAFILKEIDQNETDIICNILSVSNTHLGVLLFRAKQKLRMCIEGKILVNE